MCTLIAKWRIVIVTRFMLFKKDHFLGDLPSYKENFIFLHRQEKDIQKEKPTLTYILLLCALYYVYFISWFSGYFILFLYLFSFILSYIILFHFVLLILFYFIFVYFTLFHLIIYFILFYSISCSFSIWFKQILFYLDYFALFHSFYSLYLLYFI